MDTHDYLSYEDFGRKFFEIAVTEERVANAVGDIAGNDFVIGPMGQGPGKIAKVTAKVKVQKPRAERIVGETITFTISIQLEIDMVIDLRLDKQRFKVAGRISLRATAYAAEPLLLILDVSKPRPSDITVDVSSTSLRGEVLRILAGVDDEIRRFTAKYVSGEIDSPPSQRAKVIDVAERLDKAWTGV